MHVSHAWLLVPLLASCASVGRVPTPVDAASLRDAARPDAAVPAPPADDGLLGDSYTKLRLGAFDPSGDLSALDTGVWADVAFGREFIDLVSVQASLGYFQASGSGGAEVYGVPLMLDARLGVPIAIVEPYVGGGIGGVWANVDGGFGSESGFAGMWDAFVGVELGLGGFALGAEYRYVQSGDLDAPVGGDYQLEGNVFSVTGTLPF